MHLISFLVLNHAVCSSEWFLKSSTASKAFKENSPVKAGRNLNAEYSFVLVPLLSGNEVFVRKAANRHE